jgi:hypothetical protein
MKIISKHKDYYDGLQSHDASMGVYERKTQAIPVDWIGFGNSIIARTEDWRLATGLIGFCGKIYPYIKYDHVKNDAPDVHEFIYSFEDFERVRNLVKEIKPSRYGWTGMNDLMKCWDNTDNAKLWYDQAWSTLIDKEHPWGGNGRTPHYVVPKDVFIDHKVPYYALEYVGRDYDTGDAGYRLILNPVLADYKFYRIVDSYTAYQEIEMFMNNQIVRPDDPYIEPVSDKIKAESHGFDKFSFRKDKKVKKRKK